MRVNRVEIDGAVSGGCAIVSCGIRIVLCVRGRNVHAGRERLASVSIVGEGNVTTRSVSKEKLFCRNSILTFQSSREG